MNTLVGFTRFSVPSPRVRVRGYLSPLARKDRPHNTGLGLGVYLNWPALNHGKEETLPVAALRDCTVPLSHFLTVRQLYKFVRQAFFYKLGFRIISKASIK